VNRTQTPTFWVRDIPIYGDAILAPMAGYSDVTYRAVCQAHGSAMNYTEFVASEALLGDPNPQWRRLDKKRDEYPVVFQIFGNDAHKLLAAAQRIEEWNPHIIDINMGCSVDKVSGRGAGVGMMTQPKLVAQTFRLLSKHLSVPVTGKIRLGWDDEQRNYLEIAKIMEDNGASLIAMHGRTKQQKYQFKADWDAIAELKQAVSVPVIGNGDIRTPDDIRRMKAYTGCDAVMIGRGAVGNPWIFSYRERASLTRAEIADTIRLHLREMLDYYEFPEGMIKFHRHLRRYFTGLPLKPLLNRLINSQDLNEFDDLLNELAPATA
jgi:nifR3 family TIM-barrel protein